MSQDIPVEVNKAKPFFAPKPIEVADGAVPCDPAKSPDHKKTKTLSARDRYRIGVRRSLNPEAPRVTTEVEQYKYMIDNVLLMLADGEHVGQLWVRKDIKEKFPIIHIVAMAYLCIDPTSAECERIFSSAGRLVDNLRCSLHPWKERQAAAIRRTIPTVCAAIVPWVLVALFAVAGLFVSRSSVKNILLKEETRIKIVEGRYKPRPVLAVDPRSKMDPGRCARWLDRSKLGARRRFTSQGGVDWWVYMNFFMDSEEPGFYMDVGAIDYFSPSDSYFLDRCLGWRGVCSSPDKHQQKGIASYRSCALVPYCMTGPGTSTEEGLKAIRRGKTYGEALLKKLFNETISQVHPTLSRDGRSRFETSPCVQLGTVMKFLDVGTVDLLTLNNPGDEFATLQGIDWVGRNQSNYTVEVIVVTRADPRIAEFLEPKGYTRLDQFLLNDVYVLNTRITAMKPFTVPYVNTPLPNQVLAAQYNQSVMVLPMRAMETGFDSFQPR
ncbi:hypothetical protein CYMTET_25383 [Cymbomonas tetramitiformis]|uniref:HAT C-terminal dimerisation domain-containing protein n=1 Tax=Cymbomonas tetramitiformis TaxID=36881 RepID=A0AAE0KYZ0_9CHLO|nr:hypothetical protein CYMTET_25383 [Cymbomonas tetramitiformis]